MPLRFALARENPPITVHHFEESLARSSRLSNLWLAKQAERIEPILASIRGATMKTLPGSLWLLERGYPADFGPSKARGDVQVNVQVNQIAPEVFEKAARLLTTRRWAKPLALQSPPEAQKIATGT
jgi:hypothetical protein